MNNFWDQSQLHHNPHHTDFIREDEDRKNEQDKKIQKRTNLRNARHRKNDVPGNRGRTRNITRQGSRDL